jgi:hypothetical protein
VKRHGQQRALARRDRAALKLGEDLYVVAVGLDPRSADEDGAQRRAVQASELEVLQPRCASSCSPASERDCSESIAPPRPSEALATRAGSAKCVVASTIARARICGSSGLKIPEPTKTPSAPSCIINEASAGVAMPPAQNSTTGSLPSAATPRTSSSGAASSLAALPARRRRASSGA